MAYRHDFRYFLRGFTTQFGLFPILVVFLHVVRSCLPAHSWSGSSITLQWLPKTTSLPESLGNLQQKRKIPLLNGKTWENNENIISINSKFSSQVLALQSTKRVSDVWYKVADHPSVIDFVGAGEFPTWSIPISVQSIYIGLSHVYIIYIRL